MGRDEVLGRPGQEAGVGGAGEGVVGGGDVEGEGEEGGEVRAEEGGEAGARGLVMGREGEGVGAYAVQSALWWGSRSRSRSQWPLEWWRR